MHQNVDPFAFQARQTKTFLTVGVSLLVVAVLFGFLGSGVLGMGRSVFGPVTQAMNKANPAVTAAGVNSGPVTLDSQTIKKMPQHNLDWLKHLERIEKKRNDLATAQMSATLAQLTMLNGTGATDKVMQGLLDSGDVESLTPSQELGDQAKKQKAEWKDLIADFDSLPPPTDCVPIRNAYAQALGETSSMINEVLDAISGSGDDPKAAVSRLMKLRGKSGDRIDVAAKQSDDLVQQLCDEYAVRKWFSIKTDIGGGMGPVLGGLEGIIGK